MLYMNIENCSICLKDIQKPLQCRGCKKIFDKECIHLMV